MDKCKQIISKYAEKEKFKEFILGNCDPKLLEHFMTCNECANKHGKLFDQLLEEQESKELPKVKKAIKEHFIIETFGYLYPNSDERIRKRDAFLEAISEKPLPKSFEELDKLAEKIPEAQKLVKIIDEKISENAWAEFEKKMPTLANPKNQIRDSPNSYFNFQETNNLNYRLVACIVILIFAIIALFLGFTRKTFSKPTKQGVKLAKKEDYMDSIFIVGCGDRSKSDKDLILWKYDANGIQAKKFGNGKGFITFDGAVGPKTQDIGYGIALSPSNKLLVAGLGTVGTTQTDMALFCFLPGTGELDTTFGRNGWIVHKNAAAGIDSNDQAFSLQVDNRDKIVVVGSSIVKKHEERGNIRSAVTWRYNLDGSLDSFGDHNLGFACTRQSTGFDGEEDGRAFVFYKNHILMVGKSTNASKNFDMTMWRFDQRGVLKQTIIHHNAAGGNGHDWGRAIAIDQKGRIIILGHSQYNKQNYKTVLWCYTQNGKLDPSFGQGGIVVFNNIDTRISDLVIDKLGRIIFTGCTKSDVGDYDMIVYCCKANGVLDKHFSHKGYVVHKNTAGGDGLDMGHAIALGRNNSILITGWSQDKIGKECMVIWKFRRNGSLDTSFGRFKKGFVIHSAGIKSNRRGYDILNVYEEN